MGVPLTAEVEQQTSDPSAAQPIRCYCSSCLRFMGVPPNSKIEKESFTSELANDSFSILLLFQTILLKILVDF
ncbi:hypothetical protein EBB54_11820 [Schaedlerella arabinosiphila]|uniref:Uncharacterized protein n=1 Tax=Schaedlerella arabinosiphila TaxID=2044587 RepID=A0A3R8JMU8_9FIRM|nr:hypothetical protein EBB54_11820 [Schaedlerella arabinosiphila]